MVVTQVRPALIIFYDSRCPLCMQEMIALSQRNSENRLDFEDIHREDFNQRFPHIDPEQANAVLHAQRADGSLLLGLDVTAEAWALTGNHWFRLLRLPGIKPIADRFYRLFARHRYRLSRWLTGKSRCDACSQINQ